MGYKSFTVWCPKLNFITLCISGYCNIFRYSCIKIGWHEKSLKNLVIFLDRDDDDNDDVAYYDAFDLFEYDEEKFEQTDDSVPEDHAENKSRSIEFGPHPKFSRGDEKYTLDREFNMVTEQRFICSMDLLLDVFAKRCQTPGCTNIPHMTHHLVGTTLIVNSSCQSGHIFRFCSSHEVNLMYVNNIQIAAAVLLSGNNFGKVKRLAASMNLALISKSTYFRIQRLYLLPAVDEWWGWMRNQLMDEFRGQGIIVGGDGQCDSPGFNAKNLCYFIMEVGSKYTLHVEIVDKRHVGLVSSNMEIEGLKKSLTKVQDDLNVVELVTDASTSVKKLLGKIKFRNCIYCKWLKMM